MRPSRIRRIGPASPGSLGNQQWHVWTESDDRYVLRLHAAGRTSEAIDYEARVVGAAAAAGWPVPVALGAPLPLGDRYVSVLTWLRGRARRSESAGHQLRRGALLARLHADLRHLGGELGQRPTWYALHDLGAMRKELGWEHGLRLLDAIRPDLVRPLRDALGVVERNLTASRIDALPTTVVHGDFTRWNLLFVADRLTGVIDFDLTHLDSRTADLAMARAAYNPAVLDGYRAEARRLGWPLTSDEEAAVRLLDAAMRLGIVAWELYDLRVAGVMDVDLVARQVQRLVTRT